MNIQISFEKPEWNNSPYGSDKLCVIVRFPNCDFKWMSTYKQIVDIQEALKECEEKSWKK